MVTVEDLKNKLSCEILSGNNLTFRQINNCYIGDLLSWVMVKAKPKDVWITVIGNINSIAVAKLTDISCILLVENSELDSDAMQKAKEQGIIVLRSNENSYKCALTIANLLKQ